VRVHSKKFVATFESDGIIRAADPQLRFMIGWPDDKARAVVKKNRWRAVVVSDDAQPVLIDDPPAPTKAADYQPMVFLCVVCGAYACFGYDVALMKGQIGTWYCSAHRPERGSLWQKSQRVTEMEKQTATETDSSVS